MELAEQIEKLWADGEVAAEPIEEAIRLLDAGEIRVAEPSADGWVVNEWVKKAILLYFRLRKVEPMEVGGAPLPRQDPRQERLRRSWRARRSAGGRALRLVPLRGVSC